MTTDTAMLDQHASQPSVNSAAHTAEGTAQTAIEEKAHQLALSWGWREPTYDVICLAKETLRLKNKKSGEYLVECGLFTQDEIERFLEDKPKAEKTLAYLESINPQVGFYSDRFKAANSGYPIYDLKTLNIEPVVDSDTLSELDRFDMVLAKLDHDDSMLLLFSSYEQLTLFNSLGRDYTNKSVLYKKILNPLKQPPYLALSQSLGISQLIREMQANEAGSIGTGKRSNHWSVNKNSATVSREEKELARLIDYCLQEDINDISLAPESSGAWRVTVRRFGDMVSPPGFEVIHPEIAQNAKRFLLSRSGANPGSVERIQEPRDGSITYSSSAGSTFMRLSFIPPNHRGDTSNALSVSIRLLPQGAKKITMSDLNLNKQVVEDTKDALSFSNGLILVVGPTNSGKSTTIAGALNEHMAMFGETRKRLSLEDPIERFLEGIIQFEPSGESSDRFDQMLRAFKRHDPDLVWAGEVRDRQTAELCVDTSSSGHMVLTTLHANDTVTGVDLLGRWVPPTKTFQLIESLSLIISQRLVKTVCPHCHGQRAPNEEEKRTFYSYLKKLGEEVTIPEVVADPNLEGCDKCRGGFDGMVPINESLPMTRAAKDAALQMVLGGTGDQKTLASNRTLKMLDSGLGLVEQRRVQLMSILS